MFTFCNYVVHEIKPNYHNTLHVQWSSANFHMSTRFLLMASPYEKFMFYPSYPINGCMKNHIRFKVLPLQLLNMHGFVLLCENYSFQYKCQNLIKHTSKIIIGKWNKNLLGIDYIHWCKASHLFFLLLQCLYMSPITISFLM
jgi:hypothetical protein